MSFREIQEINCSMAVIDQLEKYEILSHSRKQSYRNCMQLNVFDCCRS